MSNVKALQAVALLLVSVVLHKCILCSVDNVNQRYFQELCIQCEAVCQQCLGEVENIKVFMFVFLIL